MIATKINWVDEWFSSKNSEEIFLNDNNLNWIKIKRITDISIDNIPGIMKADSHPSKLTKVPAINAPLPIPMPPKIPFIPKALPFFYMNLLPKQLQLDDKSNKIDLKRIGL